MSTANPGTGRLSVSRRTMLTAAATVGVGAATAGVVGVASAREYGDGGGDGKNADPIVVHVRDVASGRLDIFVGTRRIELRDKDLARDLAEAAGKR